MVGLTFVAGLAFAGMSVLLLLGDLHWTQVSAGPKRPTPTEVRLARFLSSVAVLGFYGAGLFLVIAAAADIGHRATDGDEPLPRSSIKIAAAVALSALFVSRQLVRRAALRVAGNPTAHRQGNTTSGAQFFVAMEYYAVFLNRTYKVYITDHMLSGAKVGGLVASPTILTDEMLNPLYWAQSPAADFYDGMDVTSKAFLKYDWVNFQIQWAAVKRITFDPSKKWGMGNVPHSGKLLIHLSKGGARELILLGRQDGESLRAQLERAAAVA
jgi:hypothetical protein